MKKIGQMLIVDFPYTDFESMSEMMKTVPVGGVILLTENLTGKSASEISEMNSRLQSISPKTQLFLAVDQEGGTVSRLKHIIGNYPAPSEYYRKYGIEGIEKLARSFSRSLRSMGFNLNFAPVIDTVLNTNSPVASRCLSADPKQNERLARRWSEVSLDNGILSAVKHYPGYGTLGNDPHYRLCKDAVNDYRDIGKPFFGLTDVPMIMTSHTIFQTADSLPATLSPKILGELKRNFSNIVISDDINMNSITYFCDYRIAALKAIQAGCDIVISISPVGKGWVEYTMRLFRYLRDAARFGKLDMKSLDNSVRKILRWKIIYIQTSAQ